MWCVLEKPEVLMKNISFIKDTYDNVVTSVRGGDSETGTFLITIGLYQGSAWSPYVFILVIDEAI
jgi:hypothetical protein